jgi:hypothetical protein
MSGIPKGGSARFAVLVTMQEHKARVGPMIVGVRASSSVWSIKLICCPGSASWQPTLGAMSDKRNVLAGEGIIYGDGKIGS